MIKNLLRKFINPKLIRKVRIVIARYFGNNHIIGLRGNQLKADKLLMKRSRIHFYGKNNNIIVGGGSALINCNIEVFGNNNVVEIGKNNLLTEVTLWIEDTNGRIHIGNNNKFCGKIHIASVEGQDVIIGDENLFSSHIYITTTDSHSIVDLANGKRINPSLPVKIGDHNWVGTRTVILKGVSIGRNIIVGAGAIVAKSPEGSDCVIAGNPAKVIKHNVSWDINRIKI